MSGQPAIASGHDLVESPPLTPTWRHRFQMAGRFVQVGVGLFFLFVLLVLAATIPGLNVLVLGYLMEVSGRVARTGRLRSTSSILPQARRTGIILLAIWLWLLPIRYLSGIAHDSWLLSPGSKTAWLLVVLLVTSSLLIATHLLLAIGCGGSVSRFLRPVRNVRCLSARVRRRLLVTIESGDH